MRYVINELGLHYLYMPTPDQHYRAGAMQFPFSVLAVCAAMSAGLSFEHVRGANQWNEQERELIMEAAAFYEKYPRCFPIEARCMAVSSAFLQLTFPDQDLQLLDLQPGNSQNVLVFGRLSADRQQLSPLTPPGWISGEIEKQWLAAAPKMITIYFDSVYGEMILLIDGLADGMACLEEDQWMDIVIQCVSDQV